MPPTETGPRSRWLLAVAILAGIFGIASVASAGRVLFGPDAARAAAGQVVGFVVVFNFLAGFAYLAAAAGLALGRRWAAWLSAGIAAATLLVFLAFGVHVLGGGAFERRTVAAMVVRSAAWVAIALVAWRGLLRAGRRPPR